MRVQAALALAVAAALLAPGPVVAEDSWSLERSIPVKLAGAREADAPYARSKVAGAWREILGSTGRLSLERRQLWVGPAGRLFVAAEVPEALANQHRDLDIYLLRDGAWEKRGELAWDPSQSSRIVSRTLLLPDLPEGAVDCEVHVRGVHRADWQELISAPVPVAPKARMRMGFGLEGVDGERAVPIEVVIGLTTNKGGKKVLFHREIKPAEGRTTWQEVEFDLSSYAGSDATFVFRSRPTSTDGPAPGVVWGAPEVSFELERKAYPIVALVSVDSLRASSLGIYGSKGGDTPFLDSWFGKHGAAFTAAVSPAVTTLPAHMTLMTSLNPCVHGVTSEDLTLASNVPTLASLLSKAGWETVAFTDGGALAGEFGFARGFDRYDEGDRSFPPSTKAPNAIDRATAWLRKREGGGPVFVFIHTYSARPFSFLPVRSAREAGPTREYRTRVREVDASLKVFASTMSKRGEADRSLFVVTSGHGEEFGEHGALGHGTQLYEESARVPLLVAGGRVRGGRRFDEPVGLIDVAPTLLDLLDVEVPNELQGKSVARPLTGGRFTTLPYRFVEAHRPKRLTGLGRVVELGSPAFAVRDGRYKVVMNGTGGRGTTWEAYDLGSDAGERRNLAGNRMPRWADRLAKVLQNYPGICRRLARRTGAAPRLDAADREKLSLLGYLR